LLSDGGLVVDVGVYCSRLWLLEHDFLGILLFCLFFDNFGVCSVAP
jgi:hypothetical protein